MLEGGPDGWVVVGVQRGEEEERNRGLIKPREEEKAKITIATSMCVCVCMTRRVCAAVNYNGSSTGLMEMEGR